MNYAESIGAKYYEISIKKAMNGEINNIFERCEKMNVDKYNAENKKKHHQCFIN